MEPEAMRDELERLAASEQLSRSKRLLRFLHFTVERTLSGSHETLSEYTIGREVYDRSENFDPLTDGIVRVEAHRLRSKLREYYRSAGRQDPIIIEYPVGSYVPAFRRWAPEFLPKNGQMAEAIRAYDWSASSLGPMANWPRELKSALSLCLQLKFPALLFWAPDFVSLHNDEMHALINKDRIGRVAHMLSELQPENGAALRLAIDKICETKEPLLWEKTFWLTDRTGAAREHYFTTSFSPVMDANGNVAGVLAIAIEVTDSVLQQRRYETVTDLASAPQMTREDDACREAARILEQNPYDIPFASIYLLDATKTNAEFRAGAGIQVGTGATPEKIPLTLNNGEHPLASAVISARPEVLEVGRQFGLLPSGAWKVPPREIVVVPLRSTRERELIGAIIAGVNPYQPVNSEYRAFLEAAAKQISALILRARAHGRERKLTAEMEQQKRTWAAFLDFAAVEFRTPLTVAIGLLDKILGENDLRGPQHAQLTITRRSTLRLLNAVDTLIDLISVQTDRLEPVFEPVDLSTSTEELARAFASELARPNIHFSLDCPSLGEETYVDRRLWDRLILSLLVSAVHRTKEGEIGISIRRIGAWIDTAVWDTGTSIPDEEKPHIFEPFHKAALQNGRAGAGLALARQFAVRHGGHVTVQSESGKGNKFVVSIPRGRSHLQSERVMETPEDLRASLNALHAFVEDAMRWAPEQELDNIHSGIGGEAEPSWRQRNLIQPRARRILLAISDRDLRNYLSSAVGELYTVESVSDGQEALKSLQHRTPDLLLVDAELRVVDGLALVRAVRADSTIGSLPIVLLSARSSEEDRLHAFTAGASDYLIKPFSAPELLVRMEAQMALADKQRRILDGRYSVLKDAAQLDLLRAVVDQLPIGVAIADRASRELVIKNRKLRELLGKALDHMDTLDDIPETFGSRPDGTPLHYADCALVRAVEHGEIVLDETMIYELSGGDHVPVAVSASPIRGHDGDHIGAVVLYRPVSELALVHAG